MNLLAHVCEIMGLFPSESDQALAELVGRMNAEKRTGAATGKSRRAGLPKGKRAGRRSRK
ncbi:MAG: hypothetical protein PHE83_00295 [Opitutaceae bacterium]|nr:hypothetical protein [Opitutaceae bacterium]